MTGINQNIVQRVSRQNKQSYLDESEGPSPCLWSIHDDPRKAVEETIRICKGEDVLKDYLEREEAAVVMFTFADQERATRLTMEEERREGEKKGAATQMESDAKGMYAEGIAPEVIARIQKTTVDVVKKILGLQEA